MGPTYIDPSSLHLGGRRGPLVRDHARDQQRRDRLTAWQHLYLVVLATAVAAGMVCRALSRELPISDGDPLAPLWAAFAEAAAAVASCEPWCWGVAAVAACALAASVPLRHTYPPRSDVRNEVTRRIAADPRAAGALVGDVHVYVRRNPSRYLVYVDLRATGLDEVTTLALLADVMRACRMERNEVRPYTGPLPYEYVVTARPPYVHHRRRRSRDAS